MMNQGVMDSPVTLVIKAPNQKYDDQKINCHPNWTVEKLKAHLSDVYPSKPVRIQHNFIDSFRLQTTEGSKLEGKITENLHLVILTASGTKMGGIVVIIVIIIIIIIVDG